MAISNNDKTISTVKPHTIKKFELIEKYIETWAQKVLQNDWCEGIVFIDCMCNSGVYTTPDGKTVYGTPIRVSRILRAAAGQYPNKKVYVYLNDNSAAKIELLRQHLPKPSANFQYSITEIDANERLMQIGPKLSTKNNITSFCCTILMRRLLTGLHWLHFFNIGERFLSIIWYLILSGL